MMKGLRTFLYELKYAFLQMKRHIMLCFSAISAIGITLLLIGSILIIGLHVNYFSNDVQKDLSIHVILNEDIDDETAISSVQSEISKLKNVSKVEVSSKDDELELMIKEKGDAFKAYRGETNPLSNAFFVYVKNLARRHLVPELRVHVVLAEHGDQEVRVRVAHSVVEPRFGVRLQHRQKWGLVAVHLVEHNAYPAVAVRRVVYQHWIFEQQRHLAHQLRVDAVVVPELLTLRGKSLQGMPPRVEQRIRLKSKLLVYFRCGSKKKVVSQRLLRILSRNPLCASSILGEAKRSKLPYEFKVRSASAGIFEDGRGELAGDFRLAALDLKEAVGIFHRGGDLIAVDGSNGLRISFRFLNVQLVPPSNNLLSVAQLE